jgi:hypothetical protein
MYSTKEGSREMVTAKNSGFMLARAVALDHLEIGAPQVLKLLPTRQLDNKTTRQQDNKTTKTSCDSPEYIHQSNNDIVKENLHDGNFDIVSRCQIFVPNQRQ